MAINPTTQKPSKAGTCVVVDGESWRGANNPAGEALGMSVLCHVLYMFKCKLCPHTYRTRLGGSKKDQLRRKRVRDLLCLFVADSLLCCNRQWQKTMEVPEESILVPQPSTNSSSRTATVVIAKVHTHAHFRIPYINVTHQRAQCMSRILPGASRRYNGCRITRRLCCGTVS